MDKKLIADIEKLRIELDSLIKKVKFHDTNGVEVFHLLVEAKDKMGMAQLKLQ